MTEVYIHCEKCKDVNSKSKITADTSVIAVCKQFGYQIGDNSIKIDVCSCIAQLLEDFFPKKGKQDEQQSNA